MKSSYHARVASTSCLPWAFSHVLWSLTSPRHTSFIIHTSYFAAAPTFPLFTSHPPQRLHASSSLILHTSYFPLPRLAPRSSACGGETTLQAVEAQPLHWAPSVILHSSVCIHHSPTAARHASVAPRTTRMSRPVKFSACIASSWILCASADESGSRVQVTMPSCAPLVTRCSR